MALTENQSKVFNYLTEHDGENFTAQDIADATGLAKRSVDGIVTSAFQRKKLTERIPAVIELTDGEGHVTQKSVKFIKLTDLGREFDPTAEVVK